MAFVRGGSWNAVEVADELGNELVWQITEALVGSEVGGGGGDRTGGHTETLPVFILRLTCWSCSLSYSPNSQVESQQDEGYKQKQPLTEPEKIRKRHMRL